MATFSQCPQAAFPRGMCKIALPLLIRSPIPLSWNPRLGTFWPLHSSIFKCNHTREGLGTYCMNGEYTVQSLHPFMQDPTLNMFPASLVLARQGPCAPIKPIHLFPTQFLSSQQRLILQLFPGRSLRHTPLSPA